MTFLQGYPLLKKNSRYIHKILKVFFLKNQSFFSLISSDHSASFSVQINKLKNKTPPYFFKMVKTDPKNDPSQKILLHIYLGTMTQLFTKK